MYLVTAQDLQERLMLMVGGQADQESVSDIRSAIRQALRFVAAEHNWPYYHDYLHLTTNELYDTGEITYTASTRTVTLTSGTWPSWAAQGTLIIDLKHARVEAVASSTSLTVIADDAPVDDYTGTYSMYQYRYTLNTDDNIYKVGRIQVDQANWIDYVPPSIFETDIRRQWLTTGGRPRWWTISRDSLNTGQNLLCLWPYPTTELRLRMGYFRSPRDILTWDYQTGQVATTASSASITGTGTAFVSRHVGALLRTGSDRINVPTNLDGRYPPVNQSIIKSVTNDTTLTTVDNMTSSQSDVSLTISDLVDAQTTTMMEVVAYAARREFAKLRRMDPKLQQQYEMDYQQALYLAKCQANSDSSIRVAGSFRRSQVGWPGIWDSAYTLL